MNVNSILIISIFTEDKIKSESPLQPDSLSVTPATTTSSPMLNLLPEWIQLDAHLKYTTEKEPCCRAFCKLKRKDHYHCNACNQVR